MSDMVDAVRCKDCMWLNIYNMKHGELLYSCPRWASIEVEPNGYCYKGSKQRGEDDDE